MKKNFHSIVAFMPLVLIAFSSTAQESEIFKHVPAGSSLIYHINLPVINAKMDWADLMSRLPIPSKGGNDLMETIKDPARAGIDAHRDLVIAQTSNNVMDSTRYSTYILHILDTAKFRHFITAQEPGLKISKHSDNSYSAYKNNMGIAWNKDYAVLVSVKPSVKELMAQYTTPDGKDKETPHAKKNYAPLAISRSLAALRGFTGGNGLSPDMLARFAADDDVQIYMDESSMFSSFSKMMPAAAMGGLHLDSLFGKNHQQFVAMRFEAGQILITSTSFLSPQMQELYKNYHPAPYDPELIARIPKGELLGVAEVRSDLSKVPSTLNKLGLGNKVDSFLATKHVSMDDIINAFTGDIMFAAVSGTSMTSSGDSSAKKKPDFFAVLDIKDPGALHRLGASLMTMPPSKDSGDQDHSMKKNPFAKLGQRMAVNDHYLVFSKDAAMAKTYLDNTEKRPADFVPDYMIKSPFFVLIDIHAVVDFFLGPPDASAGDPKKAHMREALQALNRIEIYGGGALQEGGEPTTAVTYMAIKMTDTNQNALKTLVNLFH